MPTKAKRARGPGPADIEIGKLMRLRRVELGLSQETLGIALGVTFQQVQKYEKGVNRVSASRLQAIATTLEMPIHEFYRKDTRSGVEMHSMLFDDPSFGLRLLRAYSAIKDVSVQRHFVTLMESVAGT